MTRNGQRGRHRAPLPEVASLMTVGDQRVSIFGLPLNVTAFDDAVATFLAWKRDRASRTAHFCNVHLVVAAHDDPEIGKVLRSASFNATDGMPLVWMARLLGYPAERVSGPDVMLAVMDQGRRMGVRHYLYGGQPQVVSALERRLRARLPGLEIVGRWSPPFRPQTSEELDADLERIQAAAPDFVWVGLGAPKQDLWVESVRDRLRVSGLMAVGAAFDFHSGARRRAPRWMRHLGLEWLFRLATEPRRLWRRYLTTNTRFVYLAVRELLATWSRSDPSSDAEVRKRRLDGDGP